MKNLLNPQKSATQNDTVKNGNVLPVQQKQNPFLSGKENTNNPFIASSEPTQMKKTKEEREAARKEDEKNQVASTASDVSIGLPELER